MSSTIKSAPPLRYLLAISTPGCTALHHTFSLRVNGERVILSLVIYNFV